MRKTVDGRRHGDNVRDVPAFAICPAPRCCRPLGNLPDQVCGQPATRLVRGSWWFEDRAFCNQCAPAGAIDLSGELAIRRVHMRLEVYIAGTSGRPREAQIEALAHVRRALHDAGALCEVIEIRSTFGRYPASLPPDAGEPAGRVG
jgi:hypothetical protein